MTGAAFYTYVLAIFKRTDKSTEAYQAMTDAVREMKRRFDFDEVKTEKDTTDTITVAGDYQINMESDLGLLIGDVVAQQGEQSRVLDRLTKERFDELYPNPASNSRGDPKHYCIFGSKILIGPVPSSTAWQYHISYTADDGVEMATGTAAVPFTTTYRETLRHLVLKRLFALEKDYEKADRHEVEGEKGLMQAIHREQRNSSGPMINVYRGI